MAIRTFRIFGEPPRIGERERAELTREIARLRGLLTQLPGPARVAVGANPAGLLGTYTQLLLEGTVGGLPSTALLPHAVRQRFAHRPWFSFCLSVLDGCVSRLQSSPARGDMPSEAEAD
ncbi:MAG: hypothetical protein U0232_16000 [Thermomicrobiales bacterium]